MSFRVAHQILSVVGKRLVDENLSPSEITVEIVEEAAIEHTEKNRLCEDVLRQTLDAWTGVEGTSFQRRNFKRVRRPHKGGQKQADAKTRKN